MLVYSITMLTESVAFIYHDFVWVIFTAVSVRLATPARAAAPAPSRRYPALVRATSA